MPRSTACCWCMRWRCRTTPRRCCARCGACWRAGGRLLAVIPNRRGMWARTDTTPFGHGRPYSRSQITALLRETWFTPTGWGEALYVPPIARAWFLRSAVAWERTGATISAPFAGVHIVEATKQVYRAIPARRERRRLVPALEPALAPSTGGAARSGVRVAHAGIVRPTLAALRAARHRRRAGRDGAGGGDAAGSDPAGRRSRSRSGACGGCGCGAPPVMKAGRRIDIARLGLRRARLVARVCCGCRVLRFARLIGLSVARHEGLRVRRNVGLRLARAERRLARTAGRPRRRLPRNALPGAAGIADRCRRLRAAAAGSSDCSGGTAPAPPRSGGNNARHAESSSRPRPDRRRTGRHARAGDISPRRDWPFRESSRRGRWIHTPVSAGCDCGGCYCCCCYCCCCARACACCDDAADRFSWLVVQQLPICGGSAPSHFPNPIRQLCRHQNFHRAAARHSRRSPQCRAPSGDDPGRVCLNILLGRGPCRGVAHLLVTRPADLARHALNR